VLLLWGARKSQPFFFCRVAQKQASAYSAHAQRLCCGRETFSPHFSRSGTCALDAPRRKAASHATQTKSEKMRKFSAKICSHSAPSENMQQPLELVRLFSGTSTLLTQFQEIKLTFEKEQIDEKTQRSSYYEFDCNGTKHPSKWRRSRTSLLGKPQVRVSSISVRRALFETPLVVSDTATDTCPFRQAGAMAWCGLLTFTTATLGYAGFVHEKRRMDDPDRRKAAAKA
jgi:hypothetical protein